MTDSLGYTVTNHYNNQGLLIAFSTNFWQVTRIGHGVEDRPVSITGASEVTVQMTYVKGSLLEGCHELSARR